MAIEETKCDYKEPENPSETKELKANQPVKRKSNIKIIKPVKGMNLVYMLLTCQPSKITF